MIKSYFSILQKKISAASSKKLFFFRKYLVNTEPLTCLGFPLNAVFHVLRGPVPQDTGTPFAFATAIF
jgi:hypothetical protein